MKKFLKSKLFGFIILMVLALVTVISGASSFSRFEMNYHDEIIAEYADFCLSHDGDGKSTILTNIVDSSYTHSGSMSVSVVNQIEKDGDIKTSLRMIEFTMRTPTAVELAKGEIYDVWGSKVCDITEETKYYDVILTDSFGAALSSHVQLGIEKADNTIGEETEKVNLGIKRKKSGDIPEIDGIEYITIVIETSLPYKNTLAFQISVSNRKIMFTNELLDYYGNKDLYVNIITSHSYVFDEDNDDMISLNPVKISLNYDDSLLVFDYERFRLSVEGNLISGSSSFVNEYSYGNGNITLYLKPGSDIDLHFYIKSSSYSLEAQVYFDMDENKVIEIGTGKVDEDYTDECAGLFKATDNKYYIVNK